MTFIGAEPSPYQIHDQQVIGDFQTDLPHAIAFELECRPGWALNVEDNYYCQDPSDQLDSICSARHYYGPWFSAFEESYTPRELCETILELKRGNIYHPYALLFEDPEFREYYIQEECMPYFQENRIESLVLCERPHWFSSGPHRAAMVVVYEGLRYVLALEEGCCGYSDNVFVQALSREGVDKLDKSVAMDITYEAMFMLGVPVNPRKHSFRVIIEDSPYVYLSLLNTEIFIPTLAYDACTDSEYIDNL